jgi:hypothetical protein
MQTVVYAKPIYPQICYMEGAMVEGRSVPTRGKFQLSEENWLATTALGNKRHGSTQSYECRHESGQAYRNDTKRSAFLQGG